MAPTGLKGLKTENKNIVHFNAIPNIGKTWIDCVSKWNALFWHLRIWAENPEFLDKSFISFLGIAKKDLFFSQETLLEFKIFSTACFLDPPSDH